jgi:hypothetical protein
MATAVNMSRAMDNYLDLKFLAIGDSGVGKVSNEFRIFFLFNFS